MNQTKEEVRRLVDEQSRLVELQQKLDDTVEKLQEVDEMLDILRLESDPSRFSGRIEIAEWGSKLALPSKDRRRQLAVVGFVGGIGLSFALFLLHSSRRVRPCHQRLRRRCPARKLRHNVLNLPYLESVG